jgi:hypothetical protein
MKWLHPAKEPARSSAPRVQWRVVAAGRQKEDILYRQSPFRNPEAEP